MIRKANVDDVKKIQALIGYYARREAMLPRSLNEIYESIRDFYVYSEGSGLYGCCALHVDWEDLAEIKSLAVVKRKTKQGIGARLLAACLGDAKALRVKKVFALTYVPEFFERAGFTLIDKAGLPHKIWSECIKCVHFPDCDEHAMLKEI